MQAQAWPAKPLTIVVPYAAGSATDTLARIMADRLGPKLGQFMPVGFYGFLQFVLTVRNEPGMATLADFIKRAKSKPPLTSGAGTPWARLITATLAERLATEIIYVPYKAAPQALADLLSGQIDMTFADVAIAAPQMKAGKVKTLVKASASLTVAP